MKRRNKKQDILFKRIVWLVAVVAVIFLTLQLRETPITSVSDTKQTNEPKQLVVEDGFEVFEIKSLDLTFQFPHTQAPLKAASSVGGEKTLLSSRDFSLAFYDGPGFVYQPWDDANTSLICKYDGALHNFSPSNSGDCLFSEYTQANRVVLTKSFENSGTTKHVTALPVYNRRYFLVISSDYIADCGSRSSVCEARSLQLHDKLVGFTNALLEKNHNLFTQ